jgi:hypothetical protein
VLNLASETFVTNNLLHYTNTATLQQSYFTETCARSAIAAAVLDLASETFVTNNLLHYTNTATLQQAYFTESCARSAISAAVLDLASETFVTNNLLHYTNTATLQQSYFTETCARSAIAAAVLNLASETFVTNNLLHYTNTATLQQIYFTESCARSAITAATLNLASETFVTNNLLHYTNTATLQQAYFTESCARSAITAATLNLASETFVNNQLSHYTTTASLQQNYFTETCARAAITVATLDLKSDISEFDPAIVWDFSQSTAGWSALRNSLSPNSSTLDFTDGAFTAAGLLPSLAVSFTSGVYVPAYQPDFASPTGLSIQGSRNTIVKVRIKRTSGTGWVGRMYYATAAHGFSTEYYKDVPDSTSSGKYRIIEWDAQELTAGGSDWVDNTITQLGFDFGEGQDQFEVDYVAIGTKSPFAYTANLEQNYFTRADTTSAIATATLGLVSSSALSDELSHYTTTASLQQAYFTESCARAAITAATLNLASETFVTNALGNYTTTSDLALEYLTRTCLTGAIASAGLALSTTINDTTVTIEDINTSIDGVTAQNFIKIDNAGHISGYGLSSTNADGIPTAEFGVRADQFWVAPPATASSTAPTTNLYPGRVWVDTSGSEDVTKYYTGSAWSTTPQALPFVVQAAPTTLNGVAVPAGVYIDQAFIKNGSIVNAQIADATIDKAKIASLDADDITAGTMSADRLSIDNVGLDTAVINGVESLILRNGGVFVDNLSVDSVGVVKFSLNNNYGAASQQSFAFSNFTASEPYYKYEYTESEPGGFTQTVTVTLPELLTLTINNTPGNSAASDLKEGGEYYVDFSAVIVAGAQNNDTNNSSALVLAVKRRLAGSTGSYSDFTQFGSHAATGGVLPLVPIQQMNKVTLSQSYDYKLVLYGFLRGLDTNNSNQRGFSSKKIRLFRIAKATT